MQATHHSNEQRPVQLMLSGAGGQMGQAILALAAQSDSFAVVARFDRQQGFEGQPLGQVIIDVSHHSQTPQVLQFAIAHRLPLVIGTTALTADTQAKIDQAAADIAICQASNFSLGAAVLGQLVQQAAGRLPGFEVAIKDVHHVHKQDAPSGTALTLQELLVEAGGPQPSVESIREGEVIGEHAVTFTGPEEQLSLSHVVNDRRVFARGALWAAQRLMGQPPGVYPMAKLLQLS